LLVQVSGDAGTQEVVGLAKAPAHLGQEVERSARVFGQESHDVVAAKPEDLGGLGSLCACGPRAAVEERDLAEDLPDGALREDDRVADVVLEVDADAPAAHEVQDPAGIPALEEGLTGLEVRELEPA